MTKPMDDQLRTKDFGGYDSFYMQDEKRHRGNYPVPDFTAHLASQMLSTARILDIGGGVQMPLAFARAGLDVTVYETAASAVTILNRLAAAEHLRLVAKHRDGRELISRPADPSFDVVMLLAVLHHLPRRHGELLIKALKRSVVLGAHAVILTYYDDRAGKPESGSAEFYISDADDVPRLLGDRWTIVSRQEATYSPESDPTFRPRYQFLIARYVGSTIPATSD